MCLISPARKPSLACAITASEEGVFVFEQTKMPDVFFYAAYKQDYRELLMQSITAASAKNTHLKSFIISNR